MKNDFSNHGAGQIAWKSSFSLKNVRKQDVYLTLGDEVYRFSPFDWANATHRYNPLARIAKAPTFAQRFTEVSILADLFLDKDNKTLDTFSEAGKSIFVAACLLAIQRGTPNLGEVNKIVAGGDYKNAQYKTYADEAEEDILRELWTNAASASSRLLTSNI